MTPLRNLWNPRAGLLTTLLFRAVSSLVVDFIAGIVHESMREDDGET